MVQNTSFKKKAKTNHHTKHQKHDKHEKHQKLSQCDIDILKVLRNGGVEVIAIHEKLATYSDQEVSLNLSWLEQKGFLKKVIFAHPAGFKTTSYQLDALGRDFIYKKQN